MKSVKKHERERRRAGVIETAITYLECGDYVPPLREFYPLIREMLENAWAAMSRHRDKGWMSEVVPSGVMGVSERPQKYVFDINCCYPVGKDRMKSVIRAMPRGSDARIPSDATVAVLQRYGVAASGKMTPSLPTYYYSTNTTGHEEGWFPVVWPSTVSAPVYRVSGTGSRATWAEGQKGSTPTDSVIPYMLGTLNGATADMWTVRIAAENGKSGLVFLTSEEGVKGFFELRTAPTTGSGARRAALQHFVDRYVRRPATTVRCHFRGREEFKWFGFDCTVRPPKTLLETVNAETA